MVPGVTRAIFLLSAMGSHGSYEPLPLPSSALGLGHPGLKGSSASRLEVKSG